MLSPGSRPYFNQAILQSAAATNPWSMVTKKEAKLRARRLAEVLDCPYDVRNHSIAMVRMRGRLNCTHTPYLGQRHGLAASSSLAEVL